VRHQHDRNRLAEIDQPADPRIIQDRVQVADIGLGDAGAVIARKQLAAHGHGHGISVDVHHPGVGRGCLGDFVYVACGGDARADVEELPDAPPGEEPDRAAQERPVRLACRRDPRVQGRHRLGQFPVGDEVMTAAQPVVIHPGDMRHACVEVGRPAPRGVTA
jgi:hypothetical protein